MFLPLGDTPNPRITPYVNYLLIGANIAVFLLISLPLATSRPELNDPVLLEYLRALVARGIKPTKAIVEQVTSYDLFMFRYGFRPADPSLGSLFSSLFLHGNWMHLAGNMLFLWIFGDNVEHRLGRLAYLVVYLATGVGATLFFTLFSPDSPMPLVGASGAISGVLGCYFLWFPRNSVKVFVFLFPFIIDTFLMPARLVLGFYLLVDNLVPFLLTRGVGFGVAHGAHIGGFLAGMGVAFAVDRLPGFWRQRQISSTYREVSEVAGEKPPAGTQSRIAHLLGQYDPYRAALLYETLKSKGERMGIEDETVLAVGDFLLSAGEYDRAHSLFRRFIAERPTSSVLDRALLGAGKSLVNKPRHITSAYQYFLAALDVAKSRDTIEEAKMYLRTLERSGMR